MTRNFSSSAATFPSWLPRSRPVNRAGWVTRGSRGSGTGVAESGRRVVGSESRPDRDRTAAAVAAEDEVASHPTVAAASWPVAVAASCPGGLVDCREGPAASCAAGWAASRPVVVSGPRGRAVAAAWPAAQAQAAPAPGPQPTPPWAASPTAPRPASRSAPRPASPAADAEAEAPAARLPGASSAGSSTFLRSPQFHRSLPDGRLAAGVVVADTRPWPPAPAGNGACMESNACLHDDGRQDRIAAARCPAAAAASGGRPDCRAGRMLVLIVVGTH